MHRMLYPLPNSVGLRVTKLGFYEQNLAPKFKSVSHKINWTKISNTSLTAKEVQGCIRGKVAKAQERPCQGKGVSMSDGNSGNFSN